MIHSQITTARQREHRKHTDLRAANRHCAVSGFLPAFKDSVTGEVYLSRFRDHSTAPIHLLDGLPDHWVTERDEDGRVTRVRGSIMAGFVRDGRFYSRDEAACLPLHS